MASCEWRNVLWCLRPCCLLVRKNVEQRDNLNHWLKVKAEQWESFMLSQDQLVLSLLVVAPCIHSPIPHPTCLRITAKVLQKQEKNNKEKQADNFWIKTGCTWDISLIIWSTVILHQQDYKLTVARRSRGQRSQHKDNIPVTRECSLMIKYC